MRNAASTDRRDCYKDSYILAELFNLLSNKYRQEEEQGIEFVEQATVAGNGDCEAYPRVKMSHDIKY